MKIVCENCRNSYDIDPGKMMWPRVKSKCKSCGKMLIINKPAEDIEDAFSSLEVPDNNFNSNDNENNYIDPADHASPVTDMSFENHEKPVQITKTNQKFRFGVRIRLFLFFFLIPIILIALLGYLFFGEFTDLSSELSTQSTKVVKDFAEQIIGEKAHSVAAQVQLYLDSHPNLKPDQFNDDPQFKKIALQKVGTTGYTALHKEPEADGIWHTYIHANPKILGSNFNMTALEKPLGKNFPGFWKIYTGVQGGKESKGYYTWLEPDGKTMRDKFMVSTPVPGTPYYATATTYLDEFTMKIDEMRKNAELKTNKTRNTIYTIFGIILIAIGGITFWYGRSLTTKIKSLTDLTEMISVGNLETEINIKSNDEIGDLGNAINRMQDSIRISIERLRHRR